MSPIILVACVAALASLLWLLYLTGSGGDYDRLLRTRLHRAWRRIVFWAGDVRRIRHFPWVTWDVSEHLVEYREAVAALARLRAGDVGLHREKGYLSNLAIPGFMKHAWLHLNGPTRWTAPGGRELHDTAGLEVVEAVSEGVLRRSALYPIRSDYTIILRPRGVEPRSTRWALEKARRIVGCQYDVDFQFDIEAELERFGSAGEPPEQRAARRHDLEVFHANLRAEWDGGFSCSEAVSFAWWHERERLGLRREPIRGKNVILPDRLLNRGFEIVWLSDSVTPEVARKLGCSEEGLAMIREFRERAPRAPEAAPGGGGRFWRRLQRRIARRLIPAARPTSQTGSPGSPPAGRAPGSS
jgi:hypothetical protein